MNDSKLTSKMFVLYEDKNLPSHFMKINHSSIGTLVNVIFYTCNRFIYLPFRTTLKDPTMHQCSNMIQTLLWSIYLEDEACEL